MTTDHVRLMEVLAALQENRRRKLIPAEVLRKALGWSKRSFDQIEMELIDDKLLNNRYMGSRNGEEHVNFNPKGREMFAEIQKNERIILETIYKSRGIDDNDLRKAVDMDDDTYEWTMCCLSSTYRKIWGIWNGQGWTYILTMEGLAFLNS